MSASGQFRTGLPRLGLRWLKFNAVGAIGIVVQVGVLMALNSGLRLDYLPATALAVEAAVIHNFVWHERFTWADRPRAGILRFLKFNLTTGAVSIAGNIALMAVFAGEWHLPPWLANLSAITVCSLANFLVSDRVVFQAGPGPKTKRQGRPPAVNNQDSELIFRD